MVVIWLFSVVLMIFGATVFFGAPYLPTLTPQVKTALDLLALKPGQTLLELGSGDGKVLLAAARQGYRVVGIELNPVLAAVSWARTRKYQQNVQVIWGNYWTRSWPASDGVYTFLIDGFMRRLDQRMRQYGGKLVSVAFKVPDSAPKQEKNGVYLYDYGRGLARKSVDRLP